MLATVEKAMIRRLGRDYDMIQYWHRLVRKDWIMFRWYSVLYRYLNKIREWAWSIERYNRSKRKCRSRGTKSDCLDMRNGRERIDVGARTSHKERSLDGLRV